MLEIEDINWKDIREKLNQQEWVKIGTEEFERRILLGTVSDLTPSGKYYTLFACSNITQQEAETDEVWWINLKNAAEERDLFVEQSDVDPCDIMIGETKTE